LIDEGNDVLLISRHGMSLKFTATDDSLRPMGRSTEGVKGMSFREGDSLLSASFVSEDGYVFVVTEGGYAKRTSADQYRTQSRGGLGIKVARLADDRGVLAGGLIVSEDDEVLVVLASGKVVRSAVAEVPAKGRDTMGVVFARAGGDDRIIAIARNSERGLADSAEAAADPETAVTESADGPASSETPEESTDA
jgi:DNA gyrase subunit A